MGFTSLFFPYNAASKQFENSTNEDLMSLNMLIDTFSDSLELVTASRGKETFTRANIIDESLPTSNQAEIMIENNIPLSFIKEVYTEIRLKENLVSMLEKEGIEVVDLTNPSKEMIKNIIKRNKFQYINYNYNQEADNNEELRELIEIKRRDTNLYDSNMENYIKTTFNSSYFDDVKINIYNLNDSFVSNSISEHRSFYAIVYNLINRGTKIKISKYLENLKLTNYEYNKIIGIQHLILNLIKNGTLNDKKWNFSIDEKDQFYVNQALEDIFVLTEMITKLAEIKYNRPIISFEDNINSVKISFNNNETFDEFHIELVKNLDVEDYPLLWIEDKVEYKINILNVAHNDVLNYLLKYLFGYESFRESQTKIIENFLNGDNTIGILPTGHGKSIIFYFAVLLQPVASIVVAPINSLIIDQTTKLKNKYLIGRVINLTSDNPNLLDDQEKFHNSLFTFISPERLQIAGFRNRLISLYNYKFVGQIILDEVHCLSEWGHDFRVPYLMLSNTLNKYCKNVSYLGLTATAQVKVINDLKVELNIKENKDIIYNKSLKRNNLRFIIRKSKSRDEVVQNIESLFRNKNNNKEIYELENEENSYVVFSQTKSAKQKLGTNRLHHIFSGYNKFSDIVGVYNGDFREDFTPFMEDEKRLLFATKAFGMGVDKPNIRMTIHAGMPGSREAFYQEAGRAGRDNNPSDCILYSVDPGSPFEKQEIDTILNSQEDPYRVSEMIERKSKFTYESDIWTPLFFFSQQVKNPIFEGNEINNIYQDIKKGEKTFSSSREESNNLEKNLYSLHKLGVIDTWTISYEYFRNTYIIKTNKNNFNINSLKENAVEYITKYNDESITEYERRYIRKINKSSSELEIFTTIRDWYQKSFIEIKLQQIKNMYYFMQKYSSITTKDNILHNISDQIQNEMDLFFDLSNLLDKTIEGYNLEFRTDSIDQVVKYAFSLEESKIGNRLIELEKKATDLKPEKTVRAKKKPKSKDTLQSIIDKVNEQYFGDFTEGDRVIIQGIFDMFMNDEEVKNFERYAKENNPTMFIESLFPDKFKEIATSLFTSNHESFEKLFTDKEFYNRVMEAMARELYKKLRK